MLAVTSDAFLPGVKFSLSSLSCHITWYTSGGNTASGRHNWLWRLMGVLSWAVAAIFLLPTSWCSEKYGDGAEDRDCGYWQRTMQWASSPSLYGARRLKTKICRQVGYMGNLVLRNWASVALTANNSSKNSLCTHVAREFLVLNKGVNLKFHLPCLFLPIQHFRGNTISK